jgi:diguanylate cyclase (GGDEF)-like protein/PAS domain S-box-containing protein
VNRTRLPAQSSGYDSDLERICVRNLLEATDEIIYFKDRQSRFIWLSTAWGKLSGRDPGELLGMTDFDVYNHDHAAEAYADEQEVIATGLPMVNKQEHETWPDRPDRWVSSTKMPLRDDNGEIIGTFGISRDITRLVLAEEEATRKSGDLALAHAEISRIETQLRAVLDTSADAIALYDANLRYQFVNSATERILGLDSAEILGRTDREIGRTHLELEQWETRIADVLTTGQSCIVDFSLGTEPERRDFQAHLAAQREKEAGPPVGVVTSTREVTELKRAQDELYHQAVHDPVTGLANRVLLMDRLAQALARMQRRPTQLVLLFIDLDQFKQVNDTFGHSAGDRLLVEIGRRLTGFSRHNDTVARFGGDEFVLIYDDVATDDDLHRVLARVMCSLAEPFLDGGRELFVTASVGVVVTSDSQASPDDLLRDADAAMYQAKASGRNCYQFFDPVFRERASSRYALETELARALERQQFRLEYQPVFSLPDQQITGAEALIRWDHPQRGIVPPVEFIETAEDRGLIVPIGTWVLDEACRQLVEFSLERDPALPPLTMAVNVSGRQLCARDFVAVVRQTLDRHDLAPAQLCVEVTETALLQDIDDARDALVELAGLGVHVALDDFGTGYSSLAHLLKFPVDVIKIDRSFVSQLGTEGPGNQIVAAVTAMAHVLGMTVVAEGIETDAHLQHLVDLGCDNGQGYLLGRPMRPGRLHQLLNPGSAEAGGAARAPEPGTGSSPGQP